MGNAYKILLESLKGRDHMEDLGTDGKIILELRKMRLESVDWIYVVQQIPLASYCEHGNEPFGSREGGEFLDQLSILLAVNDSTHVVT
jgi:hypothetical protein